MEFLDFFIGGDVDIVSLIILLRRVLDNLVYFISCETFTSIFVLTITASNVVLQLFRSTLSGFASVIDGDSFYGFDSDKMAFVERLNLKMYFIYDQPYDLYTIIGIDIIKSYS